MQRVTKEQLADPTYIDPYIQDNMSPRGNLDMEQNRPTGFLSHRDLNVSIFFSLLLVRVDVVWVRR